jgi:glycosyltransferase involved in cell wall biosynthesis
VRVLFLSGSAPPVKCGVGDYTTCLSRALAATGDASVALLTSLASERMYLQGPLTGVDLLPPVTQWSLHEFTTVHRHILRWAPDLLHVQWPTQNPGRLLAVALAHWFRYCYRKPVVITLHEHIPPRMRWELLLTRAANAVVSVRPDFQAGFAQGLSKTAASKPFHFIPNAPSIPYTQRTHDSVAAVRKMFAIAPTKSLVAYFGLLYPSRGVELLFQIADPLKHHLVIIGTALEDTRDYHSRLVALADTPRWRASTTFTGFLPDHEAATLLACAEAVVLPFRAGGGIWNTSIHSARLQETFVLTTSRSRQGYDYERNTYWARPDDIEDMKAALHSHIGVRRTGTGSDIPSWQQVAERHWDLYACLLGRRQKINLGKYSEL